MFIKFLGLGSGVPIPSVKHASRAAGADSQAPKQSKGSAAFGTGSMGN